MRKEITRIGAVKAVPAGGAAVGGTGLWKAPAMGNRSIQDQIHRFLWLYITEK